MKKQVCLTALSLCLLTGCSGAKADISNSNQTLFTIGSTKITSEDEYQLIKKSNGGSMTIELAKHAVYDQIVPATDQMKEDAEKEYEDLLTYYQDLENQLQSLGYDGKEDYINSVIVPEQQDTALQAQYFQDNKDAIRKQYKPSIAIVLKCDNEDIAKDALAALQKGDEVTTVYETYSSSESTFTNEEIVLSTSDTTVPPRMINQLYKAKEKGVLDEVFTFEDGTSAAFVGILVTHGYDNNVEKFQQAISSKSSTVSTEMFSYYFKKLGFEIYDQDIFDYMKVNNPEFLINNPELAKKDEK